MDKILVEGLKVDACIGVYDWERKIRQRLVFDFELGIDIAEAANGDDLSKTVDYAALSERVVGFVSESEFQLIEALAEEVATLVLAEYPVRYINIKLSKPGAVEQASNIAVVISRESDDHSKQTGQRQ